MTPKYSMFSDAALAKFSEFLAVDAATRKSPTSPEGAFDDGRHNVRFRRQMAADKRRMRGMARDELNDFDPDTVNNIMRLVSESFPEDVSTKLMKILHEVCPGILGDMPGLDDADEDAPVVARLIVVVH